VTALGATNISRAAGARRCSGSVREPAVAPWNGYWSEKDVGTNDKPEQSSHSAKQASAALKTCRYRPDILRR